MDDVVVIGYGAHARTLVDSIEQGQRYRIVGYTDVERAIQEVEYPYLGNDNCLQGLFDSGIKRAVIGVGQIKNPAVRIKLYRLVKSIGFMLPVIIDPSVILARKITIGEGTFLGKGVIIETGAVIGKMCIINTHTMISHDGVIGDFSHVTVANICGGASVGCCSFVGAGATIASGVKVGDNALIGAGTVVVKNVEDNMRVINKLVPIVNLREHCSELSLESEEGGTD